MAYGRLEVYTPDGAFETFLLNDANISLGRSTGNMIALDIEGISRYHLSISHESGETRITDLDSANGTFIDGVKLENGQPRTVYGGEEIQIGEVRLIFYSFDETPTRPVTVPGDSTQHFTLPEGQFTLQVAEPEQAVSPGAHISAQLTIQNTSPQTERYTVEVSGLPADWVRIDRRELEIAPEKAGDVLINFKPRRRSDSTPGDYPVIVVVRAKSQPNVEVRASFPLRILPYSGFGMALESRQIRGGQPFRLHVHNQGSAALPLTITTRETSDHLRLVLTQPRISLAPGQRMVIQGQFRAKSSPFFGEARRTPVDLLVRSSDASGFLATTRLYVNEKPPLPTGAKYVIGGVAVALLALIVVGLSILFQPVPRPLISEFLVNQYQIEQGESLLVRWQAQDVTTFTLLVNGVPFLENIPGDESAATLDIGAVPGDVQVTLRGTNGAETTERSQLVTVRSGFRVNFFSLEPTRLVRYVAQPITIRWDVLDAESVQFSELESFSTTPLPTTYEGSGTINLVGIPTTPLPLTITLTARRESGETLTRTFSLELIDPQCTASAGDVALYGAPDSGGQILATIQRETRVTVNAQDSSGGWLRVRLPGGAEGWGRTSALVCDATFNPADLLKVISVPTALPDAATPTANTPAPITVTGTSTRTPTSTRTATPPRSDARVIIGTPTITTLTPVGP